MAPTFVKPFCLSAATADAITSRPVHPQPARPVPKSGLSIISTGKFAAWRNLKYGSIARFEAPDGGIRITADSPLAATNHASRLATFTSSYAASQYAFGSEARCADA